MIQIRQPSRAAFFDACVLLPFLACVSVRAQSSHGSASAKKPATVVDLAVQAGSFRTLAACLEAADLVDVLKSEGPFTVFAPTDAAFDNLGTATVAELLLPRNKEALQSILKLHVLPRRAEASRVVRATVANTLGGRVDIKTVRGGTTIGGAKIIKTDLEAGNGIVHVIDSVIVPPKRPDVVDLAASNKDFSTLLAAVRAAGLLDALKGDGPFTVFAPSNRAFAKLPDGTVESLLEKENRDRLVEILKLHVVAGRLDSHDVARTKTLKTLGGVEIPVARDGHGLTVGGVRVTTADNKASNGIVHVVDAVILPTKPDNSVVAVAVKAGKFDTLVAAVKAAGLADALMGDGPFTVLAPTDEAFAKLGERKIAALLEPANRELLASILKYHVIPGKVTAVNALQAGSAKTLQGMPVEIALAGGRLQINGVDVVGTDIEADNGIIHVIDSVLLPPKG
ncbi:MAG: fasciclin domain-containing protein [Planctomycetota bacterium]